MTRSAICQGKSLVGKLPANITAQPNQIIMRRHPSRKLLQVSSSRYQPSPLIHLQATVISHSKSSLVNKQHVDKVQDHEAQDCKNQERNAPIYVKQESRSLLRTVAKHQPKFNNSELFQAAMAICIAKASESTNSSQYNN